MNAGGFRITPKGVTRIESERDDLMGQLLVLIKVDLGENLTGLPGDTLVLYGDILQHLMDRCRWPGIASYDDTLTTIRTLNAMLIDACSLGHLEMEEALAADSDVSKLWVRLTPRGTLKLAQELTGGGPSTASYELLAFVGMRAHPVNLVPNVRERFTAEALDAAVAAGLVVYAHPY